MADETAKHPLSSNVPRVEYNEPRAIGPPDPIAVYWKGNTE